MLKQTHVVEIIIPRYAELRVENVWPLVKEIDEFMNYFPDCSQKQFPDRKFMYTILTTLRFYEQWEWLMLLERAKHKLMREMKTILFRYRNSYTIKFQVSWYRK